MTIVGQITPFTCALACFESFCRDQNIEFTQKSLLQKFPKECNVGAKLGDQDASGAMTCEQFQNLCRILGFKVKAGRDFRREVVFELLNGLAPNQTAIFFIVAFGGKAGQTHYVRLKQTLDDAFEVMNPEFQNPHTHELTWEQFVKWDTTFILVSPNA